MTCVKSGRLTALALALVAGAGCAGAQKREPVVWPPPPEVPRIEYVRTISSSGDVSKGAGRLFSALSGKAGFRLKNPTALALTPDEKRLYVSCTAYGRVFYFDLEGGGSGVAADDGGLRPKSPFGLAVDGQGNLYVADEVSHAVFVYSAEGKFLRKIGESMFERPSGLAFDRARQLLYVVDGASGGSQRHRVEVFAPDGRHLRTIGTRGSGPAEFNFPSFVTVAPDGRLLVADTLNFRIQFFDPDGTLLTTFGSVGEGPGQFAKLKGMAFDSFGDLYTVDGQTGLVWIFSPGLKPLMAFGGLLKRPEFMHNPVDIVIDSKNNIYVSDFGFHQVNQYVLVNTTAADVAAADGKAPANETGSQPTPAPAKAPDASAR